MPNLHRTLLSLAALPLLLLAAAPADARDLLVEGGPGGGPFRTDCGKDYVVGIYVRSGAWIDAIGLKCSSFGADDKYRKPAINRPYFGGSGGGEQTGFCPDRSFMSGIMFGFTRDGNKPKYVDFVELVCTDITNSAQKRVCLQTGDGCQIGRAGAPGFPGTGVSSIPAASQFCQPGEAVKGLHGRHGSYVDALALICGPQPQRVKVAAPPPPPPCPAGQMRYQGKCQVPPVLPGTQTGSGGGFIQMFPDCGEGRTFSQAEKKCVAAATTPPPPPPPPPANTCEVKKDGAVYDKSGGSGKKTGELAAGTQGVTLLQKDGANWFRLKWPAGEGWVYSGPGYPDALKC